MNPPNKFLLTFFLLSVSLFAFPPMEHVEEGGPERVNNGQEEQRIPTPTAPPEPLEAAAEPSAPMLPLGMENSFILNAFHEAFLQHPHARRFIIDSGSGSNPFFVDAVEEDPNNLAKNRNENIAINKVFQMILTRDCPLVNSEDFFGTDLTQPLSAERIQRIIEFLRAIASRSNSILTTYDQEGNQFARVEIVSSNIASLANRLKKNLEKKGMLYSDAASIQERDELADQWAAAVKKELEGREAVGTSVLAKAQMDSLKKEIHPLWIAAVEAIQRAQAKCEEAIALIQKTIELTNNPAIKARRATELQLTENEKEELQREVNWRSEMLEETRTAKRLATIHAAFEELQNTAQIEKVNAEQFYSKITNAPFHKKSSWYSQATSRVGIAEYYWNLTDEMVTRGLELAEKKDASLWQGRRNFVKRQLHQVEALFQLTTTEALLGLARMEEIPFVQTEAQTELEIALHFLKTKHAELPTSHPDKAWWNEKTQNIKNSASKFYQETAILFLKGSVTAIQDVCRGIDIMQGSLSDAELEALYHESLGKIEIANHILNREQRNFESLAPTFPDLKQEWKNKLTELKQLRELGLPGLRLLAQAEKEANSVATAAQNQDPEMAAAARENILPMQEAALKSLMNFPRSMPWLFPQWVTKTEIIKARIDRFNQEVIARVWNPAEEESENVCAAIEAVRVAPAMEQITGYDEVLKKIEIAAQAWKNSEIALKKITPHSAAFRKEWESKKGIATKIQPGWEALKLVIQATQATHLVDTAFQQGLMPLREEIETAIKAWSRCSVQSVLLPDNLLTFLNNTNATSEIKRLTQLKLEHFELKKSAASTEAAQHSFKQFEKSVTSLPEEVSILLQQAIENNKAAQRDLKNLIVFCKKEISNEGVSNSTAKLLFSQEKQKAEVKQTELREQAASIKESCRIILREKTQVKYRSDLTAARIEDVQRDNSEAGWEKFISEAKMQQTAYEHWERSLILAQQVELQINNGDLQKAREGALYAAYLASWGKHRQCIMVISEAKESALKNETVSNWNHFIEKSEATIIATEAWKKDAYLAYQAMPKKQEYMDNFQSACNHLLSMNRDLSWGKYRKCHSVMDEAQEKAVKSDNVSDSIDYIEKVEETLVAAKAWKRDADLVRQKFPDNQNAISAFQNAERTVCSVTTSLAGAKYLKFKFIATEAAKKVKLNIAFPEVEDFITKATVALRSLEAYQEVLKAEAISKKGSHDSVKSNLHNLENVRAYWTYKISRGGFLQKVLIARAAEEQVQKSNAVLDWKDYITKADEAVSAADEAKNFAEKVRQRTSGDDTYLDPLKIVEDEIKLVEQEQEKWKHGISRAKREVLWLEALELRKLSKPMAPWDAFMAKAKEWESLMTFTQKQAEATVSDWEEYKVKVGLIKSSCNARRKSLNQTCQAAPVNRKKELRTQLGEIENEIGFWDHKTAVAEVAILMKQAQDLGELPLAALNKVTSSQSGEAIPVWKDFNTSIVETAYQKASEVASKAWSKAPQQEIKEFWNSKLAEIEVKIASWKEYAKLVEQKKQECLAAAAQEAAALRQGVQNFLDSLLEEVEAKYQALFEARAAEALKV